MQRRTVLTKSTAVLVGLMYSSMVRAQDLNPYLRARPLICAHRGWTSPSGTENSLTQMRQTHQAGPFMMEIDLAKTADGTIMLMHDREVDRVTTGHGLFSALTDARIATLRLRNGHGTPRDPVPTYDKVLQWAAATPDALLMLDIKDVSPHDALQPVQQRGLSERIVVLTFKKQQAREAFAADPKALISVLVTQPQDLEAYAGMAAGRQFAAYIPQNSPPSLFQAAHAKGAVIITDLLGPTAIMDAVSPNEGAHRAHFLPIDILVTNTPLKLRAALAHQL